MVIKILIFIVSVMPIYLFALQQTRVYEKNNNREVIVEKVGELACTLTYKNGDFLTTEGMPVHYTFQVELDDAALHSGLHLWLPHPMQPSRNMTLAFHHDKKIYEYNGKSFEYGDAFYKTDLFDHFVKANKIIVTQGKVTKNMPSYSKLTFTRSVHNAFDQCITNLEKQLKTFCSTSDAAKQKCAIKRGINKKPFAGLVVKDNPTYIAKLKLIETAQVEEKQRALLKVQAEEIAAKQIVVEENAQKAKTKLAIKQDKLVAQKKREEVTAIEKAKTIQYVKKAHKKETLSIFESRLNTTFEVKNHIQFSGTISSSLRADRVHQMVQHVRFNTSKGVFYYVSSQAENYTKYRSLEFDFKLLKDPRDTGSFVIKMDCGSNCSSGNFAISPPKIGVWEKYSIKIEDLISNPGSTLDLTKVTVPFAILPEWGKQRGVVFMIDNVRLIN